MDNVETQPDPAITALVRATQELRLALDAHAAALDATRAKRGGLVAWRIENREGRPAN